ncbi:hypothetical protein [Flavobacterium sangjuense]|uniref:Uncharacterized protein n=1 Tax=Flavobacterium sangjuense TaxID=2518177 RepID=A0A4P7PUV1_9FLAO|nr:hypothetical protein [Flavobacterium sangjuense]QBZ98130.1 hypothetical protein GS03_01635 [Flavobacterium sangjuense]
MKPISKSKAETKCKSALLIMLLCPMLAFSQSDLSYVVKGGEILFSGLIAIFTPSKAKNANLTVIENVCVKNKLNNKITFIITRKTEEGDEIKKELVIQKGGKEYFYELPKGVYTYEVVMADTIVFKKGEYRFSDKSTFIVDGDIVKNPDE